MEPSIKKAVRADLKRRAEALPEAYFREAGSRIIQKVLAFPAFRKASTLMAYVSMPTEPDTGSLISSARSEGKTVLLPRCADRTRMEAVPFAGWESMRRGRYGIWEPTGPASEETPEVILIPCVAAAPNGDRLGHGAGYYDRFLLRQPGLRICLCFEAFLLDSLPAEAHDLKMDLVITENGCYPGESRGKPGASS